MRRTKLLLLAVSLVISDATFAQHPGLRTEVFVPEGMPIKLETQRDNKETRIAKYTVKRIVPDDARRATIVVVILDKKNKPIHTEETTSRRLADPMTIATGSKQAVKMLIIVRRLETEQGNWVLSGDERVSIKELAERGVDALPRAKFVTKD